MHPRHDLAGPDVEAHPLARPERRRRVAQELAGGVEHVRGLDQPREREDVAPRDGRALDTLEVHGRALTGDRRRDGLPVGLDAAHLGLKASGVHLDPLVQREPAGRDGAGHHRAEPPDREDAVDREAKRRVGVAHGNGPRERGERLAQRGQSLTGLRRDGQDRRAFEKGSAQEAADVLLDELPPLGLGQVGLGQHDQAAPDAEELADGEMLPRLRHHALVRGDHQHDEVDPTHACQHVLHEPLVPGDVHDAEG
jgi:hypothetical protein